LVGKCELVIENGRIVRFEDVDSLIDFMKKTA